MDVLRVRVSGRLAHFRKVFTNSTSLSYFFPPRTTIMGMVASAMGLERDSYYTKLAPLSFGVEALTPLRKLTMAESYLDTDEVSEYKLRGMSSRVPTTREYVAPGEGDFLSYALYIYPFDSGIYEAFKHPAYPISLGPANMLGWIESVERLSCRELSSLDGATVWGAVREGVRVDVSEGALLTVEEGVPREFNERRESGRLESYLFSINARPYRIKSGALPAIEVDGKTIAFL